MSILITAFETYDVWQENSSWVALTEYLKEYGVSSDVITRRYPVNLPLMREKLEADLAKGVSGVIHLGQRPGAKLFQLEAICLNVAGITKNPGAEFGSIIDGGPVAFRTSCPVGLWSEYLSRCDVPAEVSYHAGTYLCNAIMYLTHAWFAARAMEVPVVFVHLPLTESESARTHGKYPGLANPTLAEGVRGLIDLMRSTATTHQVA